MATFLWLAVLFAFIRRRKNLGRQQHPWTSESDDRYVEVQLVRKYPSQYHQHEGDRRYPLVARQWPQGRKRLPRFEWGFRSLTHSGWEQTRDYPG